MFNGLKTFCCFWGQINSAREDINSKSQTTKHKQITMTKIQNPKHRKGGIGNALFWSLNIGI